jgi:hypothetical protein
MLDVTNLRIKAGAYDGDVFIRSYAYLDRCGALLG